jgi:hypothetical protein
MNANTHVMKLREMGKNQEDSNKFYGQKNYHLVSFLLFPLKLPLLPNKISSDRIQSYRFVQRQFNIVS